MNALEAELRRIIAVDGPMPIAVFMRLCLAHPNYGYYTTREPFGGRGDFITAPEISQIFGELLGLWAAAVWDQMGGPEPVHLVELGPGRGTLLADALRAIEVVPQFRAAATLDLVEISPVLRGRQQQALRHCGLPLAWYPDFAEIPAGALIVLANEFFDALPVHQMVKAEDGWHERMVGVIDGRLGLALHPDPLPGFEAHLPPELRRAPAGALYEWRSQQLGLLLAGRVARDRGAALILDYGHDQSRFGGTLQAVCGHGFADVLERPGEVDLSAHVDFAALARAGARAGARVHGPVPQGVFLRRLGAEVRAAALKRAAPERASEIESAVARLLGPGPAGMGELFKVIAFSHAALDVLPGFSD
jgi:NADH dehydrogenase [ubiquinone] 1 alpha subcomplex assembly factor 7